MPRKFEEKKLLIASGNQGKIREISNLMKPYDIEIISAKEFDIVEPDETEFTFIGNAGLKSRYYSDKTGLPALSDDSGLEVDALHGEPGIYSANWAEEPDGGGERDFYRAMDLVEQELKKKNIVTREGEENFDRNILSANFTCALALSWPKSGDGVGYDEVFEGKVFGNLQFPPKGEKGFGYDPIFVAKGYDKTFAEIDPEEKYSISHRSEAFKLLIDNCFS